MSFNEAQEDAEYLYVKGDIQTSRHLNNFSIGKEDSSLDFREFALKTYEAKPSQVLVDEEEKLKKLLSYAKTESYTGKDIAPMMEDFVIYSAISRSKGKLSNDTGAMKHIVAQLNDPQTPDRVKNSFDEILEKTHTIPAWKKVANNILRKPSNNVRTKYSSSDFDNLLARKGKDIPKLDKAMPSIPSA